MSKFVINPLSNRPIRKGGSTYHNLLRDGIIAGEEKDHNVDRNIICVIKNMEEKDIDVLRREYNENNPQWYATRGRGKYDGYLVRRGRKQTKDEFVLKLAKKVQKAFLAKLEGSEDDDELDEDGISTMIHDLVILEGRKLSTKSKYILV